jgi:isochorismate hydrolase
MAAKIIDFRVHPQLKSARLDYREPAPRGRAKRASRRPAGKANIDQQIAHIAWLLRELEGEGLPQVLVAQVHASIERTRTMLQSWPAVRTSGKTDATEDAAQPNIDPALLERMYSDLGLYP